MKFRKNLSLFIGIILFFGSCTSPLEEIEIDSFKLFRTHFYVTKEVSSNGLVSDKIEVTIEDKNYKNFELKNAVVTVNGLKMNYKSSLFKRKYTSKTPVEPNKIYRFVITLANGETATTILKTPSINYHSISYPRTFILGKNQTISWRRQNNPVQIKLVLDDQSFGEYPDYYYNRTMQNDKGSFTIPGNETRNYHHATRGYFTLTFSGEALVSNQFRSSYATVETIYNAKNIQISK